MIMMMTLRTLYNDHTLMISNLSPLQSKVLFTFEFIGQGRVLSNLEFPFQALIMIIIIYSCQIASNDSGEKKVWKCARSQNHSYYEKVRKCVRSQKGKLWKCVKSQNKESKTDSMKRYGNVSEEEERPSLPDDIYCGLIETLSEKCFVTSLLEMWR